MAEVFAINALAPSIINGRLRSLMEREDPADASLAGLGRFEKGS